LDHLHECRAGMCRSGRPSGFEPRMRHSVDGPVVSSDDVVGYLDGHVFVYAPYSAFQFSIVGISAPLSLIVIVLMTP